MATEVPATGRPPQGLSMGRTMMWSALIAWAACGSMCRTQWAAADDGAGARAWEDKLTIPTYPVGPGDPDPMFYAGESYQGAQKHIYPYALQDRLGHERADQTYTALNLENEYIKLTVLPELGGRLFSATDKMDNYEFFYRQHVIKPALIGMLGAWISGGVEWCVFHHHRNTTFMPVDSRLTENSDGSRTIWIGEIERRHRMKWTIGLTLHPGKSYVETTVKLFNRTTQPHSILYWANVAVHVNDNYQILFPPSVQVATQHAKVDFTTWPVSSGKYLGADWTGVDLSWWKNMPSPNSFFAWDLREDFMGGYDHGKQAGVVHVGDHNTVCSAKLWEWGTGGAAKIWDAILTDTDGPYVELMVGAWSDNQPDYSWIKPYETKVIKQYWYPVRQIGGFKNANLNGAVNLELRPGNTAVFGFNATSKRSNARAVLTVGGKTLFEQATEIGPDRPFTQQVVVPAGTKPTDLRAALIGDDGQELIAYQPVERPPVTRLPETVKAPPLPQDIKTNEELYLTGLRIEQIHNPNANPEDYYNEALKRDPGDTRCNIILGVHANKRGQYELAEQHLRRAIERLSMDYTRAKDTEAYYELGLALRAQNKDAAAIEAFNRAAWDSAFHAVAGYQLAELACLKRDYADALSQIEDSLSTNARNAKARNLKAIILRKLARPVEAKLLAAESLAADPLDFEAANELYLSQREIDARAGAAATLYELNGTMRDDVQNYLELATDYLNCGAWDDAVDVLQRPVRNKVSFASTYPLVHYYLGYLYERQGDGESARACYTKAAAMPSDYCFPYRLETITVLEAAIHANGSDARAWYYLGTLLYEIQPDRAIVCWEKSRSLDGDFALTHRNLGWAYYHTRRDAGQAMNCYEKAVTCNPKDPRLLLELDMMYEFGNADPVKRLASLESRGEVVSRYQDSLLREIMVLVLVGQCDKAVDLLARNRFHAREGGRIIHQVYLDAHLLRGIQRFNAGRFADALESFRQTGELPENLALGEQAGAIRATQAAYYSGLTCAAMGQKAKATEYFEQAAKPAPSAWPDARYCQAMSLIKLGRSEEVGKIFDELVKSGNDSLKFRGEAVDYFSKFGEQQRENVRLSAAHHTIGLGLLGKGEKDKARQEFAEAVKLNASNVWARFQLDQTRTKD